MTIINDSSKAFDLSNRRNYLCAVKNTIRYSSFVITDQMTVVDSRLPNEIIVEMWHVKYIKVISENDGNVSGYFEILSDMMYKNTMLNNLEVRNKIIIFVFCSIFKWFWLH